MVTSRKEDEVYWLRRTMDSLSSCKLPSNGDVLPVYLHRQREKGTMKHDAAGQAMQEVQVFEEKSHIPMRPFSE
jgi:hypothetical protein